MPLIQKCAADLLAKIGNDCDRVREASMATISGRLLDYITKTDNKVGFHAFFVLLFKLARTKVKQKRASSDFELCVAMFITKLFQPKLLA